MKKELKRVVIVAESCVAKTDDVPWLLVQTEDKLAQGIRWGARVNLEACGDYDTFVAVCAALHGDETSPHLVLSAGKHIPPCVHPERLFNQVMFDLCLLYFYLPEDKQQAYDVFCAVSDEKFPSVESFEQAYIGRYESREAFGWQCLRDCYNVNDDSFPWDCLDLAKVGERYGVFCDGYGFRKVG